MAGNSVASKPAVSPLQQTPALLAGHFIIPVLHLCSPV
jgi:hypothetical protein